MDDNLVDNNPKLVDFIAAAQAEIQAKRDARLYGVKGKGGFLSSNRRTRRVAFDLLQTAHEKEGTRGRVQDILPYFNYEGLNVLLSYKGRLWDEKLDSPLAHRLAHDLKAPLRTLSGVTLAVLEDYLSLTDGEDTTIVDPSLRTAYENITGAGNYDPETFRDSLAFLEGKGATKDQLLIAAGQDLRRKVDDLGSLITIISYVPQELLAVEVIGVNVAQPFLETLSYCQRQDPHKYTPRLENAAKIFKSVGRTVGLDLSQEHTNLEEWLKQLRGELSQRGITIQYCPNTSSVTLTNEYVVKALVNVFGNIVNHGEKNAAVYVETERDEDGHAHLKVTNTGEINRLGIFYSAQERGVVPRGEVYNPELHHRLVEEFVFSDGVSTTQRSTIGNSHGMNTGQGMGIIRHSMETVGGSVDLRSSNNQTSVRLSFPPATYSWNKLE